MKVKSKHRAIETSDGVGVRLNRVFGYNETPLFDPFLLLDYFATKNPEDVMNGFPWHPHRGIETITYILKGAVEHQDSLGNKGVIGKSDVQWMTAGSGIIHQEMPETTEEGIEGFQIWLNLPANSKMTEPKYGEVKADMIKTVSENDIEIKVIGGNYGPNTGPILRESLGVNLFDVHIPSGSSFVHEPGEGVNTFIFVFKGTGVFGETETRVLAKEVVLFEGSGELVIKAEEDLRFIIGEGLPLEEPIAWGGPIVMNTREELRKAFREYDEGTFLKG